MRISTSTIIAVILAAVSLLLFAQVARQVSLVSLGLAAHGEIETQLRQSLEDQKKLAELDRASAAHYRRRFESLRALLGHLAVMTFSRAELMRQVEKVLSGVVALILLAGVAIYQFERRSREKRLVRLESALVALARGETEIVIGERRRDIIGRIAAAIESSSRLVARSAKRIRYLEDLSSWQEAARRHAHEIGTPLTAAQMEIERLVATAIELAPNGSQQFRVARRSILEELDRLRVFTRNFTSFARVGKPQVRSLDLRRLIGEFCATFANAWPNLQLMMRAEECDSLLVEADSEMIRQVLVNLCNNSALAVAAAPGGMVTMRLDRAANSVVLDVGDNGPGVAPEMRARLFEPYATTRRVGEGMGLGLAIAKKILLEHGGDLELLQQARETGATFRITLPGSPIE